LTVDHRDIENEKIEWVSPTQLKIEVTSDKKTFAADLELFGEINIEESKWNKNGLHLQFNLVKKEEGPYWKRLLKEDKKHNHITVDWSKYVDEDEEEEEGQKGLGGDWDPSMMQNFGGMGGMGGMPGMGGMGGMPGMGGMGGFPGMGGMGGFPGMGGMGGFPGMGGMGGEDDSDDEEGHDNHEGHDHGKLDDLDKEEDIDGAK